MKHYGLIGNPLTHSRSQQYFQNKFQTLGINDATYQLYPIPDIKQLPQLITSQQLNGLNVTIPYKQTVIPYLHTLTPQAQQIGAVNTIQILWQNNTPQLIGHNTDTIGIQHTLRQLIGNNKPQTLILGTGGASKAVQYTLRQLNIPYQLISRTKTTQTITYDEITPQLIATHTLIINTTPLGTYPNTDQYPPIPYQHLTPQHALLDLTYNPTETSFLKQGKQQGATTCNGLDILITQAEASWQIWNNQ